MDKALEKKYNEVLEWVRETSAIDDLCLDDPVARMMLVALLHEEEKVMDSIECIGGRISERFYEDFIPWGEVGAMPSVLLARPDFKSGKVSEIVSVLQGVPFSYKLAELKNGLGFLPILGNILIPFECTCILTHSVLKYESKQISVNHNRGNELWFGIQTFAEVESVDGLSLYITGTAGIAPEKLMLQDGTYLDFVTSTRIEDCHLLEPFDSQQMSGRYIDLIEHCKNQIGDFSEGILLNVVDKLQDRDSFAKTSYPREFQACLESDDLNSFDSNILWLKLIFPENYIVPDGIEVEINVIPLVNVEVNTVQLTSMSPVAKLTKHEKAFFLGIVESSTSEKKNTIGRQEDDIIVRDFDIECYNEGDLFRDVRNLYDHFVNDYYAFLEYGGLKDGETIRQLRTLINKIEKSVGTSSSKYDFSTGTYVMKNMKKAGSFSSKVNFMITYGSLGNRSAMGQSLENKKYPLLERDVRIVGKASGGRDKASREKRYELLRYYTLTADRIYTRLDVEAFVRKELNLEFKEEEFRRMKVDVRIEGSGIGDSLQKGLYVDIIFKDKKNLQAAYSKSMDIRLRQDIERLSCIAMPIIVSLKML